MKTTYADQPSSNAEDGLRLVIDTITGSVWSAGPDGSIEFLNQRGLDYTGFSLEQIKGLPEKPIVIGHSFGGLMTQIIVNRDLAAAGVAMHPVPPLGVFPYEFSFLKGGWSLRGFSPLPRKRI